MKNPWRSIQQWSLITVVMMILLVIGLLITLPLETIKIWVHRPMGLRLLYLFPILLLTAGVCWILAKVRDDVTMGKGVGTMPVFVARPSEREQR